ncbi:MAG: TIGR00730 family Rossman fold protein [Thermodesulfobacteriota bacterium]
MHSICVFLGSNPGFDSRFAQAARAMGEELARRGLTLVYGGSNVGLMGLLANAVLAAGGKAVGVIPEALRDKEIAHPGLTELHVVGSMHERKALMAELSDAFAALPGGMGTLEELCEVLTWGQLGFHAKPCGILNVNGYYKGLALFLETMVQNGFLHPDHRDMLQAADSPAGLLDAFAAYVPPRSKKWLSARDL